MSWFYKAIFFMCLMLSSLCLSSQKKADIRTYYGLNGALNLTSIANQNNYGYVEMRYDFAIGTLIGIQAGVERNKDAFHIELNYATMGQRYEDKIADVLHRKLVALRYIQVPLIYTRIFGEDPNNYDGDVRIYGSIGLQFAYLQDANLEWYADDKELDMLNFIDHVPGRNANIETIKAQGAPALDRDLYQDYDFGGLISLGIIKHLSYDTAISAEIRGSIGFLDMNAVPWRYPNRFDIYEPSRNAHGGLHINLYHYFGDKRKMIN